MNYLLSPRIALLVGEPGSFLTEAQSFPLLQCSVGRSSPPAPQHGAVAFAGLSPAAGSCYHKAEDNPNAIFGSSAANAASALKEGELCF